jgi:hypothetical protein
VLCGSRARNQVREPPDGAFVVFAGLALSESKDARPQHSERGSSSQRHGDLAAIAGWSDVDGHEELAREGDVLAAVDLAAKRIKLDDRPLRLRA